MKELYAEVGLAARPPPAAAGGGGSVQTCSQLHNKPSLRKRQGIHKFWGLGYIREGKLNTCTFSGAGERERLERGGALTV